ncbi:uncharacterized protein LOC124414648 [Diprion similis]|uniref:uncharacterized protein LOC124414648 n=1 Tax=Diprion similis TaxID=362088 RepID=UPI001EF782E0|nr:uncharacterized protein LOC124414648 [Diprion similis]XP_046751608.1 uncharacterized protein LOC124414648 [Diprion similis]XP_046751609.1 uncharacterized protein LOC124414648 [Diprion similis]
MEQQNMEGSTEETGNSDFNESINNATSENVTLKEEVEPHTEIQALDTQPDDVLIDHLKIETTVTEVVTEPMAVVIENNENPPDFPSSKNCDPNNECTFEVAEQTVEVVTSIDTSEVHTELAAKVTMDDSLKELIEIKTDNMSDLMHENLSIDTEECSHQAVEDATGVEETTQTHEPCDPNVMSIVEEIVTTSKLPYTVEIQEEDSSDDREGFVTKELVLLEVVEDCDAAIGENDAAVEENIVELEMNQTHDCVPTSSEPISNESLLSKNHDNEDNCQLVPDKSEIKDVSLETANEDRKSTTIVSATMKTDKTVGMMEDEKSSVESKLSRKPDNHRSCIQEIVDDWDDDNNDHIPDSKHSVSDSHDSVEIELKTLLADDKPSDKGDEIIDDGKQIINKSSSKETVNIKEKKTLKGTESVGKERVNGLESETSKGNTTVDETLAEKKPESVPEALVRVVSKPTTNRSTVTMISKKKQQPTRAGVKVLGRHLMSQIASKADVTEVIQERIKEKQKEIDLPQGGDILFVKKITQRLSSKLSGASTNALSAKISLSEPSKMSSENFSKKAPAKDKIMDVAERIETADNRELLAILEGDVDPDWSNLKPHTVVESTKSTEPTSNTTSTPVKLDPYKERELALKQLLELPSISLKRHSRKRRTFKPALSKVSSDTDETPQNIVPVPTTASVIDAENMQTVPVEEENRPPTIESVVRQERMQVSVEDHLEESRSGRKRKPTEKAREHEQNSSKKQKVYKGKVAVQKKPHKIETLVEDSVPEIPAVETPVKESEATSVISKAASRNILSKIGPTKNRIYQTKSQKMGKKLVQTIGKRNIPVKKLIRQKSSTNITNAKSVHVKSKFISSPKKYRTTMKQQQQQQKVQKQLMEVSSSDTKPKKKSNEIDKLLQDEGVVNLLYDVEQPERKRLIPITKSQTKVMDLQKVQRELKIRTKLVRNAVLRLRTSGGSPTKISPRSKRGTQQINPPENETRENERIKSTRSSVSSSGDFIFPAKIRNAAEASIIVRRHSSSSFSSTSGSPRVSIDGPDRQTEPSGAEEGPAHVTRSARRRHSQNEKNKQSTDTLSAHKKVGVSRKKSTESTDHECVVFLEKGIAVASRPNLRTDSRNTEKLNKNIEITDIGLASTHVAGIKVSTRSNGASVEKEVPKTKKGTKTKAATNKAKEALEHDMDNLQEDKLSACLAEAVSALSNVDATAGTSGSAIVLRKLKAPSNATKLTDKIQPDLLDQFSNNEINLRRHGNIVEVIMIPSSSKLKNGITLQLMQELREVLLLLRRDDGCRVVLLTSTGTSFCEGLDLSNLINSDREERRVNAEELANGVKEFIKTLANFNKPIVAGIHGAAIGLGVTMLPLFDLVIASDKATFSMPYGQLGQIPEGAAILTLSQTIGNTVTSELLLGGRTLTASEALRAGLVSRVLWPDRFQGELIPSLRAMSEHSSQSMEATKTLLRHSLRKKLDAALESESYLLIQHWCSAECQTLIKNYLDGKGH